MSSNKPDHAGAPLPSEQVVEDYLDKHPEFFEGRDELLMKISVPHRSGTAVSLIERQVVLLREQNRNYRRQLQNLIQIARTNDELISRLQQLALRLLDSTALDAIVTALENSLLQDFHADAASLQLFATPVDAAPPETRRGFLRVSVLTPESGRSELHRLLAGGQPVCGVLAPEELRHLFEDRAGDVASTALLPLTAIDAAGASRSLGLLAIGSGSDERFNPEMGTTYLKHLGELIGCRLAPCLQPTPE